MATRSTHLHETRTTAPGLGHRCRSTFEDSERPTTNRRVPMAMILVVEDEPTIADAVASRLRSEGFEVEIASDGPGAVERCTELSPDLVVLDLNLPGFDGIEVCRRIQVHRRVPVVMLTARDDETDMLVGLGVGADDYMTKPFSPRELMARIKAVLRRAESSPSGPTRSIGSIEIDPATRRVTDGGVEVHLTPTEFDLLRALAEAAGAVLSREQLPGHGVGLSRRVGGSYGRQPHPLGPGQAVGRCDPYRARRRLRPARSRRRPGRHSRSPVTPPLLLPPSYFRSAARARDGACAMTRIGPLAGSPLHRVGSIKTKLSILIVAAVAMTATTSQIGYWLGWPVWIRPIVSAVAALLMVQFLARGLTRPLRSMADATTAMARGRLQPTDRHQQPRRGGAAGSIIQPDGGRAGRDRPTAQGIRGQRIPRAAYPGRRDARHAGEPRRRCRCARRSHDASHARSGRASLDAGRPTPRSLPARRRPRPRSGRHRPPGRPGRPAARRGRGGHGGPPPGAGRRAFTDGIAGRGRRRPPPAGVRQHRRQRGEILPPRRARPRDGHTKQRLRRGGDP